MQSFSGAPCTALVNRASYRASRGLRREPLAELYIESPVKLYIELLAKLLVEPLVELRIELP